MILNLAYVEKSDIKYKLIKFSDSHTHIELEGLLILGDKNSLTIKTRLSSMDDVFVLLQATAQIRAVNPSIHVNLSISYLLGARYDRPMHAYDSFDLKLITDIINSQNYTHITVLEAHSAVTSALLECNNVHVLDDAVKAEVFKRQQSERSVVNFADKDLSKVCLVAPDLGSVKRVEDFAKTLGGEISIVFCHKDRNILTGEIRGVKVMNRQDLKPNVIIYDDLCDGGRTFIEVNKAIRESYTFTNLSGSTEIPSVVEHVTLAVTHGIFSKGVAPILEAGIDKIITTNSYKDQPNTPNVEVIDVI